MKKYNKKEQEAIELLLVDLNELDNKPRRLFYALEQFALSFDKKYAIPSLREAQDLVCRHINEGDTYSQLFTSLRKFIKEEWEWQIKHADTKEGINCSQDRIKGAEEFIKLHIKELTERRFY